MGIDAELCVVHRSLTMTPDEIKTFRISRKLSQADLAGMLGVDQATVSRIERGVAMPRPVELLLERLMGDPAAAEPQRVAS